jgi:glycosyltransferase involved in cell wall biosynthesis
MWYEYSVDSEPKLGIVIAAYNAEKFLVKTLESIRSITHKNFVCVIVNDGSTDSTGEIAESYTNIDSRFRNVSIENVGPCIARNKGFDYLDADTKYMVFADADDVIFPETYSGFLNILEHREEFVAVHGLGTFIDEFDQVDQTGAFERIGLARKKLNNGRIVDLDADEPTSFENLVLSSTVFPPGLVVHRKSILEKSGLFDPESRYAEDWDLLLRVSRFGSMKFVPSPVLYYRRHQYNVGTSPKVPGACKNVWTKTYFSVENSPCQQDLLRKAFIAMNKSEAMQYLRCLATNGNDDTKTRCVKGIIGSTLRLMRGEPTRDYKLPIDDRF